MMKQFLRKTMKNIAAYVELVLSAFLIFAIGVLIIKLVGQCFLDIWHDKLELEYYMEYAMSLAIGVEFVKMLCTHQPGTTVAHANLITGARIPEEKNRLLRNVVSDNLQKEGKNVAIGACVYYKDCALRVDSMKEGVVTRVEVIKNL